ncbi:glycosyltransferase family 4 protein [bacterium]|nr:glycosyltransferase family 4 protein [bacterium]
MRIGINASFIRKPNTGIGQVSFNFLQKLKESSKYNVLSIKQDIEFVLYLEEDISLDLPSNFKKRVFLPLWKRDDLIRKIWWEKFLLPKKVKEDGCEAFISLYQNTTILRNMVVKHIMIAHDIIPEIFPEYLNNWRKKIYWNLTKRAIKKADKIISISEHTKKDLTQYLNIAPKKISVNYVDVDPIYKKEISEDESKRVLKKYNLKKGYIYFGGGLEKRKNAARLLKAYKLLLKNFEFRISNFDSNINDQISNEKKEINNSKINIKNSFKIQNSKFKIPDLVISGKLMPKLAPLVTDTEKLVKDLGLQDKVKLLDFVPREDLPALYKNAGIFVYPSLYEGFGLPVLEAMNCGTAVICSNASSLPEVGGEAVEYFNPKDEKELAEKMKKVLNDNNLRNKLSTKGKKQAEKFSWSKFTKKITPLVTI